MIEEKQIQQWRRKSLAKALIKGFDYLPGPLVDSSMIPRSFDSPLTTVTL